MRRRLWPIFLSWDPGRRWSPRRGISTERHGWNLLSRCTIWPRPISSATQRRKVEGHARADDGRQPGRFPAPGIRAGGGDEQGVTGGAFVHRCGWPRATCASPTLTSCTARPHVPPASVAEGARVCLFGVFGKKAASRRAAPSSGIKHHMCSANVHPRRLA